METNLNTKIKALRGFTLTELSSEVPGLCRQMSFSEESTTRIAGEKMKTRLHPQPLFLTFVLTCLLVDAVLTVRAAAPTIDFQPKDQTVIIYQPAAFGVIARGTTPLSYQWRRDGVPIAGATNDQIVLAQPQFSAVGRYSVVVSNAEDSATSAEAMLTVNSPKGGDLDYSFALRGSVYGDVLVGSIAVQPDEKVLAGYFSRGDS